jgi:hypothetical protein
MAIMMFDTNSITQHSAVKSSNVFITCLIWLHRSTIICILGLFVVYFRSITSSKCIKIYSFHFIYRTWFHVQFRSLITRVWLQLHKYILNAYKVTQLWCFWCEITFEIHNYLNSLHQWLINNISAVWKRRYTEPMPDLINGSMIGRRKVSSRCVAMVTAYRVSLGETITCFK